MTLRNEFNYDDQIRVSGYEPAPNETIASPRPAWPNNWLERLKLLPKEEEIKQRYYLQAYPFDGLTDEEQIAAKKVISKVHYNQDGAVHYMHEGGGSEEPTNVWAQMTWLPGGGTPVWPEHVEKWAAEKKENDDAEDEQENTMEEVD